MRKLHTVKKIAIRNEVDRFGFSHLLARKFGLNTVPRSFACFAHGWTWNTNLKIEDFGYFFTPRMVPIVVATKYQQEFLINSGFSNVHAGGLPFAYVEKSNFERKPGSLLIMPPHSMKFDGISGIDSKLLNYIEKIKYKFSDICFCLHMEDYDDLEITTALRQRNINFVPGADPSDANSLLRTREIFDSYEYVTSTIMGSHILYAAFCGCKVSILKNYFHSYSRNTFLNYSMIQSIPGLEQRYIERFNNLKKLEHQFPWLFVDHPIKAVEMLDWSRNEIGYNNLMSKDILMKVLGWTVSARTSALIRAVSFRTFKIANRFCNLIGKKV